MRQPGNLAARIVLMNDVLLASPHQFRLCALHRLDRGVAIALRDRFLDDPDRAAHQGAPRPVDGGPAGNLACRFLGGCRIGHGLEVSFGSALARGQPVAGHSIARMSLNVFSGVLENAGLKLCEGPSSKNSGGRITPPPSAVL